MEARKSSNFLQKKLCFQCFPKNVESNEICGSQKVESKSNRFDLIRLFYDNAIAEAMQVVAKSFEKFSTTTVIRVFNFIRISTFRVERVFWICVLVGFTCTTIWSVKQTVKTFLAEPTASRVSYVSNSTTGLHFEDAKICFEIFPAKLLHSTSTKRTTFLPT